MINFEHPIKGYGERIMENVEPKRSLVFFEGVKEATMQSLTDRIMGLHGEAPDKWINLYLHCKGGEIYSGFSFYEMIHHVLRPKLQIIAVGGVMSMGVVMFLAGTRRCMAKNSILFLHESSNTFKAESRLTGAELRKLGRDAEILDERHAKILVECSGGKVTLKQAMDMISKDTTISAEEAMKLGFAHEIIERPTTEAT